MKEFINKGLDVDCKVCHKRMLNSADVKYNWQFGVCMSCYIDYLEGKEARLKEKEKEFFDEHEDKLIAREEFRKHIVEWVKEIKTIREEYIAQHKLEDKKSKKEGLL